MWPPVTNIRDTASTHWKRWLKPENRCLVPFTSFCEWEDTKPKKTATWFAQGEERPLLAFAGVWTRWKGVRGTKANPVEGWHELYGFLTTDANAVVGAIHPKAMPVILTSAEEMNLWMSAPGRRRSSCSARYPGTPCASSRKALGKTTWQSGKRLLSRRSESPGRQILASTWLSSRVTTR